jgi:hypothetical protein
MNVRRLSAMLMLVFLALILVAMPAQAARSVTGFTFGFANCPSGGDYAASGADPGYALAIRQTGPILHGTFELYGHVSGSDPRVNGHFYLVSVGPTVVPNAHTIIDPLSPVFWGPGNGTWRLDDGAGSGWQGGCHVHPWNDVIRWPDSFVVRATGAGYGAYAGMRIEFTVRSVWDLCDYVFEGDIS